MTDYDLTVAVVDSSPLDCSMIQRLLKRQHERVAAHEFHSAHEAVDGIPDLELDAILLDYDLVEESGIEILETLRSKVDIPIVCLTGNPDATEAVEVVKAGAADYLSKSSISASRLRTAISAAMEKHQKRVQERETRLTLQEQNRRLREQNRELHRFYQTLAHELRTPLTSLREFLAILLERIPGELSELQESYLRTCVGSCDQLSAMVSDLFDLSCLTSGKLKLSPVEMSAASLVAEVVRMFEPTAQRKGIALSAAVDAKLRVLADPTRLRQILSNLIDNAIKFTPQGGAVRVTAESDGRHAEFRVRDTGCGIPAHEVSSLFEYLYQGDASIPAPPGLGIGLSLCKQLVELHRGTIAVDSTLDEGTELSFTLPTVPRE